MTDFTRRVHEVVQRIPAGKVATYGDVALVAGSPGASRAVGSAMRRNPDMKTTPCHRVVGSGGSMHGYAFGGIAEKIRKLRAEGVVFNGNRVNLAVSRRDTASEKTLLYLSS